MTPDDLYWRTPDGQDRAAALCAKYGVSSLPRLWWLLESAEDAVHPNLAVALEVAAAIREEEQARAELALTAECPFCGSAAGALCRRTRGRFKDQPLGSFAERLSSPFRSASFHRRRLAAAIDAGLAAMGDDGLPFARLALDGPGRALGVGVVFGDLDVRAARLRQRAPGRRCQRRTEHAVNGALELRPGRVSAALRWLGRRGRPV